MLIIDLFMLMVHMITHMGKGSLELKFQIIVLISMPSTSLFSVLLLKEQTAVFN